MSRYQYAIGTIHAGEFSGEFVDAIQALRKPQRGYDWIRVADLPVDEAREQVAVRFVEHTQADYLLMIDRDTEFHTESLARFDERVEADGKIKLLGALCFTRTKPPAPTVFGEVTRRKRGHDFLNIEVRETFEWLLQHPEAVRAKEEEGVWTPRVLTPPPDDALIQRNGSGCAFLLVHRDVFLALRRPWFKRDEIKKGEDFYFFQKARRKGFKLWIDRSVICGHGGIGSEDFLVWAVGLPLLEACIDQVREGGGIEAIQGLGEISLAANRYET